MNGRQALGCGISAQDRTNTTTKKAANSIVGKLTAGDSGSRRGCLAQMVMSGWLLRRCSSSVSRTQRRSSPLAIR